MSDPKPTPALTLEELASRAKRHLHSIHSDEAQVHSDINALLAAAQEAVREARHSAAERIREEVQLRRSKSQFPPGWMADFDKLADSIERGEDGDGLAR